MDAHGEAAEKLFVSDTGRRVTKDILRRVERTVAGGERDLR